MKRNAGIILFIVSMLITIVGTTIKISSHAQIAEILLTIGVLTFFISIGMIVYKSWERPKRSV